MNSTATHPYYVAKARVLFARAGGDPDHAEALAAWAQELREGSNDSRCGVLVAADGRLLADTYYHPNRGATYVHNVRVPGVDAMNLEVGLAVGRAAFAVGCPVIHVKHGDMTGSVR